MGKRHLFAALVIAFLALPSWAGDESTEERLRQLEQQNKEILDRLKESERRNEELNQEIGSLRSRSQELLDREISDYLDYTEQLEGGGPKEMETKGGAFLTFYGFLRLDVYYNSARFNSVITPVRVLPEGGATAADNDQFALDVRLTRVGMLFNFGSIGKIKGTGKLEIDFANFPQGVPESRETPRIRLAYIQLDTEKWLMRLGQDWDIVSPLYPNVNHETLMWFAGNLGDRRPMIRWFYKASEKFTVDTALGLTGAIDNRDLDADGERDGFDAGYPHLQVRAGLNQLFKQKRGEADQGPWHGTKDVIGVWGLIGGLEASAGLGPNGETRFTTWAVGVDFVIPVGAVILLRGEAWYGQALSDMRGNGALSVNTVTGEEVKGLGGWFEVVLLPNEGWQFYVGGTIDDPENDTVPVGEFITKNWSVYLGGRRHWSKRSRTTIDVIFWETQYSDMTSGDAIRVNIWTSWNF